MEALNKPSDSPKSDTELDGQVRFTHVNLIGQPNLQSNILLSAINEHLSIQSELSNSSQYRSGQASVRDHSLALIDCNSIDSDGAADILNSIQNRPIHAALINTPANSPYENLAEWPQLRGIFYSNSPHPQLLKGLQTLLNDGHWLPRKVMESLLTRYRRAPKRSALLEKLTRRERQILQQLLEGATNQDIASTLYVSEHTVKSHLYNVFKKIGVSNRLQACNWAKQYL